MAHKSKFINALALTLIFVFVSGLFVKSAYENRCHVIHCSPTSWEKILDMAFAESKNDFRVDYISARLPRWNSYTDTGPAFIDITVSYVSLKRDSSSPNEKTDHPVKYLKFDDQNLITNIRTGHSWSNRVPSEDSQERLKRVTVSPRDAFRVTWPLAKRESSLPADTALVLGTLVFGDGEKKCGCESQWSVSYYYDTIVLTFYVDAQTAQVVSIEKNAR